MKITETPLVLFTLLTGMAAGLFAALLIYQVITLNSDIDTYKGLAVVVVLSTAAGLLASLLHLGRPFRAYRGLYGLKNRSPLSREALILLLFLAFASIYTTVLFTSKQVTRQSFCFAVFTGLIGIFGVFLTSRVYMLRARPAWFSSHTPISFLISSVVLGPSFISAYLFYSAKQSDDPHVLTFVLLASVAVVGGLLIEGVTLYDHVEFLKLAGEEGRLTAQEMTESKLLLHRTIVGIVIPSILGIIMFVLVAMRITTGMFILTQLVFVTVLYGEFIGRVMFYAFSRQMDVGML